jgi:hypothetical protein
VVSADGSAFRLSHSGRGVPPQITVETTPIGARGSGESSAWEARVTLGPDLPLGLHGYPIELVAVPGEGASWTTGDSDEITISPLLTVRVVAQVSLNPSSLSFGRLSPAETVARTVRLYCHDPGFTLEKPQARVLALRPEADAALPEVAQVTVLPVPGENAWDIQVLLSDLEGRFEGTFLGRLVVSTGHPEQPEVEATINGFLPLTTGTGSTPGAARPGPGREREG